MDKGDDMSLLKTSFRRIVSILIIICLISSIFCGSVSAQAHVFYDTKADFEFSEEGRNYYGVTHIRYLEDDPHYIVSIVTNTYISPPKQGHYSTNDVVSAVRIITPNHPMETPSIAVWDYSSTERDANGHLKLLHTANSNNDERLYEFLDSCANIVYNGNDKNTNRQMEKATRDGLERFEREVNAAQATLPDVSASIGDERNVTVTTKSGFKYEKSTSDGKQYVKLSAPLTDYKTESKKICLSDLDSIKLADIYHFIAEINALQTLEAELNIAGWGTVALVAAAIITFGGFGGLGSVFFISLAIGTGLGVAGLANAIGLKCQTMNDEFRYIVSY